MNWIVFLIDLKLRGSHTGPKAEDVIEIGDTTMIVEEGIQVHRVNSRVQGETDALRYAARAHMRNAGSGIPPEKPRRTGTSTTRTTSCRCI